MIKGHISQNLSIYRLIKGYTSRGERDMYTIILFRGVQLRCNQISAQLCCCCCGSGGGGVCALSSPLHRGESLHRRGDRWVTYMDLSRRIGLGAKRCTHGAGRASRCSIEPCGRTLLSLWSLSGLVVLVPFCSRTLLRLLSQSCAIGAFTRVKGL